LTVSELSAFIQTKEAQEFIRENRDKDPLQLILQSARIPWKKELASQIAWRQKLARKLPEWTSHPTVLFPGGVSTEQSSSEATARLKASLIQGRELLDITGGMGVDTFYLSEGFKSATYVEQQEDLAHITAHNFRQLGKTQLEVQQGDGLDFLKVSSADVVYADPARRDEDNRKMVSLDSYEPNLIPHLHLLTLNQRVTFIKTSPMLDISQACSQLKSVAEVWVISYRNECKEVIYKLQGGAEIPLIKTYNILTDGSISNFNFEMGSSASAEFTDKLSTYLFEPNASILKAGGADALAQHFKVAKLHPNSNLLTHSEPLPDFPGKTFTIKQEFKPYDPSLRKGRFNIISRNYPDNAEKIGKSLKIKPSGNQYLIATQTLSGRYVFIIAEWVH
tara:strand:- start:1201 stop:2376 length:1176 start_codon:yes stop_codon:yes gene_type:complete